MPTTEEQLDDLRNQLAQLKLTTRKNVPAIPLPKFKGRTDDRPFATFLDEFNAVALAMDWEDAVKCQMLPASLEGEANAIYHTLTNAVRNDWKQLLTELGQRLASSSDTNYHRQQLQNREQKDGESVSEYGRAMRFLVRRAFPDSDGINDAVRKKYEVDYFIGGLKPNVKEQLMRRDRPDSLETAIIEAQKEETLQHDIRRDYDTRSQAIAAVRLAEKQQELQEQLDEIKRSVAQPQNEIAFIQSSDRSRYGRFENQRGNPPIGTKDVATTTHDRTPYRVARASTSGVGAPVPRLATTDARVFPDHHPASEADRKDADSSAAGSITAEARHLGTTAGTAAVRRHSACVTNHRTTPTSSHRSDPTTGRFALDTTSTPSATSNSRCYS
ncbi:hypothetical protein AAVH_36533 [Aphelenchoides avenae]|nr:hypothetical protein AAVH_36533 [Aphelenchus avenae]